MKLQTGGRWVAAAVILAGAVGVSGQSAAPPPEDVLPALLAEVRGLRAAMEQMASAGPRVQLFASRLQLQEGRISAMVRRLDQVRDRTAVARREHDAAQQQVSEIEGALRSGASHIPREELDQVLVQRRRDLKLAKADLERHLTEENQLVQDLTAEQARWTAINQQLDELERALAKR